MSGEARARQLGAGCLFLFALPFVTAGAVLIGRALRHLGGGTTGSIVASGLAGVVLCVAGLVMVALGLSHRRRQDALETMRARHPEQPWLWDAQWASGRLESSDRTRLAGAWSLALFWNAVASTVFLFVPDELRQGNTVALLALLFPLVGLGILLWAVRATIRWRKFGTSILELTHTPVPLGGELRARLVTRLDPPPDSMRLVLSCVRRDHRDENTSDDIVWLEEQSVDSTGMRREVEGTVVPVAFALPADAPETERNVVGTSIHWKLHASAAVAGVDYQSRFELPVFHARDTAQDTRLAPRSMVAREAAADATRPAFDPASATVHVRHGVHGREFYFGPGRNAGAAASFGVMAGIFLAATYGLARLGVPFFFVAVCGAFALLLLLVLLNVWLGTSRVEITNDHVRVRKSILGVPTSMRVIPLDDVHDVTLKMGMSQSETALQSPRAWYDVRLQRRNGRHVTLGSNVADKREAEWLVQEIRRSLRLTESAPQRHGSAP